MSWGCYVSENSKSWSGKRWLRTQLKCTLIKGKLVCLDSAFNPSLLSVFATFTTHQVPKTLEIRVAAGSFQDLLTLAAAFAILPFFSPKSPLINSYSGAHVSQSLPICYGLMQVMSAA